MKLPSGKHAYEILIFLIVVLFAVYTHAQEPVEMAESTSTELSETQASTTTTEPVPDGEKVENTRQEYRAQLESRFQDRIFNLSRNVSNRLEASINRLDNISNRLDTRIVKLKNTGIDTASAEIKLGEARNSLNEARSSFESLPSVQQALTSDTPQTSFQRIRTIFLTTRDLLKKSHTQLSETVVLLKNAPTQNTTVATTSEDAAATEAVE